MMEKVGGFTAFPEMGVAARPSEGSAVFWYNMDKFGNRDPRSCHAKYFCVLMPNIFVPGLSMGLVPQLWGSSGSVTSGSGRENKSGRNHVQLSFILYSAVNFLWCLMLCHQDIWNCYVAFVMRQLNIIIIENRFVFHFTHNNVGIGWYINLCRSCYPCIY